MLVDGAMSTTALPRDSAAIATCLLLATLLALPACTADENDDVPATGTPCPGNALFCEDFEDGNLDGWNRLLTSGELGIDTQQAASGTRALLVDIPANERGGFIERDDTALFPLPNNTLWGRMLVYFDGVSDGHTDFVRGAAANGATPWYNLGEQHGDILLNYYSGAAADCWARPSPSKPVVQNQWTCWEWSFDGARNEILFWIDGVLSRRVSATGDGCLSGQATTWAAPDFASLRIGAYIAEPRNTIAKVWIDDIAIGTQGQLGCPAP